jgi:hypothetical protein
VAARALGQRHGQPAGVEVAVGGEVDGAQHAVRGHDREEPGRLRRADLLEREAEGLGPARLPALLQHPVRRAGQAQAPDLAPAWIVPGLGGELPVQLDAPHHARERHRGGAGRPARPRKVDCW